MPRRKKARGRQPNQNQQQEHNQQRWGPGSSSNMTSSSPGGGGRIDPFAQIERQRALTTNDHFSYSASSSSSSSGEEDSEGVLDTPAQHDMFIRILPLLTADGGSGKAKAKAKAKAAKSRRKSSKQRGSASSGSSSESDDSSSSSGGDGGEGDASSSSSSPSSSAGRANSAALEERRRRVGVYDSQKAFFTEDMLQGASSSDDSDEGSDSDGRARRQAKRDAKASEKPLRLADYVRNSLLSEGAERQGRSSSDEDEEEVAAAAAKTEGRRGGKDGAPSKLTPAEEQAQLKQQFLDAAAGLGSDSSGDSDSDSDLLTLRAKTPAERKAEDAAFERFRKDHPQAFAQDADELSALQSFWTGAGAGPLSNEDKFLRDYILNKRWVETDERVPTYEEITGTGDPLHPPLDPAADVEDDEALERQDEFEHAYNFRFEEPGSAFIQSHPRPGQIEGSVRRDTKREAKAEARRARAARKAEDKDRARREAQRLQQGMKREIAEKLTEIESIAGKAPAFTEADLEGDFDPEEFDRRMQAMFDEEWEAGGDSENERPVFSNDGEGGGSAGRVEYGGDYIEGVDSDEEAHAQMGKSRHKDRKAFLQVRERARAAAEKTGELQDIMSAYRDLEYEDMLDGNLKCRFRYTKVPAETYGLSMQEILELDDAELNRRVPKKLLAPYRHMYPSRRTAGMDESRWNQRKRGRDTADDDAVMQAARHSHQQQQQMRHQGRPQQTQRDSTDAAEPATKKQKSGRSNAERRAAKRAWKQQQRK